MSSSKVSIIVPVLNDAEALNQLLPALQSFQNQGHEVIVVDGGSTDGSLPAARTQATRVLMTGTGRGRQMNLGADNAAHDILLFLHADSRLPEDGLEEISQALDDDGRHWGRFDVRLDENTWMFSLIAFCMNVRSRLSHVATGDQGIFVRKTLFQSVGGYQGIPLMEDIALSKTLRRHSPPICLKSRVVTSARRWREKGLVSTILQMWILRLAYFLGAEPEALASIYYPSKDGVERSNNTHD